MKKNYTLIIPILALLWGQWVSAQELQKNYINYQGVARNTANELMVGESLTIGIALRFGSAVASPSYSENHAVTTDANGVFSLRIGNGTAVTGDYGSLPWGDSATYVTVSLNGSELGTTELMAVPYAIHSGDAHQTATEVPYDNATSGLSATDTQSAIDELASGGVIDADPDPTNELQMLDFNTTTNELSLSDGNTVTIPSGGTDADADPENELQHLSLDGTLLKITDGSGVDLGPVIPPGGTDDQNLILTGDVLSIESGSGTVDLSTYIDDADADPNNEVDVTAQTGILLGDGTAVSGLIGSADGQVPKWDVGTSSWVAGVDATSGGGSGTPTGLEALDEGSGIGWRLIGRDPNNYGPIGLDATDLSTSNVVSADNGATGNYATAMGEETKASGIRSTAMGYRSQSSGSVSFAVGEETVASGEFAVAMGDRTLAIEQSSTAFGAGTTASGTHSTAMGSATTASGRAATAIGDGTQAESLASLAVGSYNIGGGDAFVWQPDDPLFEIGNGSATARKNALTVLKNGNVGIGEAVPAAKLHVDGNIRSKDLAGVGERNVVADANGDLIIGAGGGGSSLWIQNASDIYYNTGNVGIGTSTPQSFLDIETDGNQWDLTATEGDFRIGDAVHRLKIGVATAGAGAGDARIRVEGGTDRMMLGGGTNDVLTITDQNVGVGTITPTTEFDVVGTVRSSDLAGVGERNVVADANGNLIIGAGGGGTTPTGLEALDEGSGIGWRLIGKDPTRYGPIGLNATDLSSGDHGSTTHGATGEVSTAAGQGTTASGPWSTALGYYTISSATGSTAMGVETNASGYASTTMGDGASASGSVATAMGASTGAAGSYATAMGQGTQADAYISTAIGSFNVGGGDNTTWQPNDPLFEIGNGTFATRSNALTVLKNGNVGIGTETPSIEMDVEGGIRSSDLSGVGERNVVADANGNLIIGAGGGGGSLWTQNGSNIHYNTGNVGIGTDTPENNMRLHMAGDMFIQSNLGALHMGFPDNGNRWRMATINSGANLIFRSKPSGTGSYTTQFKMNQNGEFQIGNISGASAWAHILKNSTVEKPHLKLEEVGADYARLEFTNTTSNALWHVAGLADNTPANSRLNFYFRNGNGAADRMTITGDGKVGIDGIPSARLEIYQKGQTVGNGLRFDDGTANQDWDITHGFALRFHYGGSLRGFINATTGEYVQSSDERLKANINSMDEVLDKVTLLRPKTYRYKSDKSQVKTMGFVAQEVQKLFPELVSGSEVDDVFGINYAGFSVVAISAIQEQQKIIESQSEKISELEERLNRLESLSNKRN